MEIKYVHDGQIHNLSAAREVLPYVFSITKPGSVIDVGCGTGSWLNVASQLGVKKILGIDGIQIDQALLCIEPEDFLQHDLTLPLVVENKYDLGICLEVAEHLPPLAAENIISILTGSCDIVLFSAAIPGQGGQAHINEQWPGYWLAKFAAHDFFPCDILRPQFWENPKVEWWYKQNMVLYIKKNCEQKLNLTTITALPEHVHPELFTNKVQQLARAEEKIACLENIISAELHHPRFFPTLKRLVKSLIK